MRRINPIIIINGIFLIVMMLLFSRFVNTGSLFTKPSPLQNLTTQLTGDFISSDSVFHLKSRVLAAEDPNDNHVKIVRFVVTPPLFKPWSERWTFNLSEFGPLELLAEGFDTLGTKWIGCELAFRANGENFRGMTIGQECGVDSAGNYLTLSLRTASDSLIFATHRNDPVERGQTGGMITFLRQPTDNN